MEGGSRRREDKGCRNGSVSRKEGEWKIKEAGEVVETEKKVEGR